MSVRSHVLPALQGRALEPVEMAGVDITCAETKVVPRLFALCCRAYSEGFFHLQEGA